MTERTDSIDNPNDAKIPGSSRAYGRVAYIRRVVIVYILHVPLWIVLAALEVGLALIAIEGPPGRPMWFVLLTIIPVVGGATSIVWSIAKLRRVHMRGATSAEVADVTLINVALLMFAVVCVFLWLAMLVISVP